MIEFSKRCPICAKDLYYSNKYKLQRSIAANSTCNSCALKRRLVSEETRRKLSEWVRTPEMRKKISVALQNHPQYKTRIGIPLSNDRRKHISESMVGRKLSETHVQHISKSLRGRKLSSEHIMNAMVGREKSVYKRKPYRLGNEIVMVQGYENLTLDKLIAEGRLPDEIKVYSTDKPQVKYFWSGKERRYYPDCYLPKLNMVVETKSDWTWKSDLDRNMSKINASTDNGYKIRVVVWNGKKQLVSDTIYN